MSTTLPCNRGNTVLEVSWVQIRCLSRIMRMILVEEAYSSADFETFGLSLEMLEEKGQALTWYTPVESVVGLPDYPHVPGFHVYLTSLTTIGPQEVLETSAHSRGLHLPASRHHARHTLLQAVLQSCDWAAMNPVSKVAAAMFSVK